MTSGPRDPYDVLGVDAAASTGAITRAYRTLARRHHPDTRDPRSSGAEHAAHEEALRRIGAAYHVLRDPRRRAAYDRGRTREPGADPGPDRADSGPGRTGPGPTAAVRPAVRVLPAVVLGTFGAGADPRSAWIGSGSTSPTHRQDEPTPSLLEALLFADLTWSRSPPVHRIWLR
jgi:curved DNA-binding protein CbpA